MDRSTFCSGTGINWQRTQTMFWWRLHLVCVRVASTLLHTSNAYARTHLYACVIHQHHLVVLSSTTFCTNSSTSTNVAAPLLSSTSFGCNVQQ